MSDDSRNPLSDPIFRRISRLADAMGVRAYVVGGYVRDYYLGRPSTDIDVVVVGSGIAVAEALAAELHTRLSVFKTFGTAMLRAGGMEVEFVGARKESYSADSRKPAVEEGTLEDDQLRRDFTINALAWSLNGDTFGELVDSFEGLRDLRERIIRTPCDADVTFSDDPLRMMRAVRFAAQLGFDILPETFAAIRRNRERIRIVSRERIAVELNKIVASAVPSRGFDLLERSGLLALIFPEMQALKGVERVGRHAHKDNFYHTLKVLDNVAAKSDDLWLRWAAVLHDIAKPLTKAYDPQTGWTFHSHETLGSKMVPQIFRRMKLPMNEHMKFVQKMVFLHLRPIILSEDQVTDSAVRRLLFEAGDDVEALMRGRHHVGHRREGEALHGQFPAGAREDGRSGRARPHPQLSAARHGRDHHADLLPAALPRRRRDQGADQERHSRRRNPQRLRRGLRPDGEAGRRTGADEGAGRIDCPSGHRQAPSVLRSLRAGRRAAFRRVGDFGLIIARSTGDGEIAR